MATSQETALQSFDFMTEYLPSRQQGLWEQAFRRLIRNRLAAISGVILLLILAASILTSWSFVPGLGRYEPDQVNFEKIQSSPSSENWLGTDRLGRDLWTRLMQGTLFSLKIGLGTQIIILAIGITVGMGAALAGRWSDTILMWLTDLAYAFPDLLAIILLRQILFGRDWPIIGTGDPQIPGVGNVLLVTVLAISFVSWTTVARLVRGQMLSINQTDYVTAARSIGATPWRVVRVHMLPNTLSAVIVAATFGIPLAIFAEATLGFIGLGVPPPNASLGSLIGDGLAYIQTHKVELIWPASMVAILMLCFTFLGDGLRDALDPRTRK